MNEELIERLRADRFEFNGDLDLEAADMIEAQQKRIQHLEFALADTEALELGTAEQLAASQAQIKVLRDALESIGNGFHESHQVHAVIKHALSQPTADSALRELLKAERERCAKVCDRKKKEFAEAFKDMADESLGAGRCAAAIRAMGANDV